MLKNIENNNVKITGTITKDFEYSHEVFGEKFYRGIIFSVRQSRGVDDIPFTVSERLLDVKEVWIGRTVEINGEFRSYNQYETGATKLILSVFAREIFEIESADDFSEDRNEIYLNGYICKKPIYRETPLGREVADILLAVNRPYGKSDYIPCIAWGRNARFAGNLEVGSHIAIEGRIQSREYIKKLSETESETRTAYEVSISKLEVMED